MHKSMVDESTYMRHAIHGTPLHKQLRMTTKRMRMALWCVNYGMRSHLGQVPIRRGYLGPRTVPQTTAAGPHDAPERSINGRSTLGTRQKDFLPAQKPMLAMSPTVIVLSSPPWRHPHFSTGERSSRPRARSDRTNPSLRGHFPRFRTTTSGR